MALMRDPILGKQGLAHKTWLPRLGYQDLASKPGIVTEKPDLAPVYACGRAVGKQ
jgi:hypothetical protein